MAGDPRDALYGEGKTRMLKGGKMACGDKLLQQSVYCLGSEFLLNFSKGSRRKGNSRSGSNGKLRLRGIADESYWHQFTSTAMARPW